MADERSITSYRYWYRKLLRLYSQPYRERFAEGMEQTFSDLCRERAAAGKGLIGFALWMFAETFVEILKQNGRLILMQHSSVTRVAVMTGCLLLIPLLGNMFVDGWNWGPFDFVIWGAIVFGAGLTFQTIARKGSSMAYTVAAGIACLTGFMLIWVNAAVGIIGDEELANAMYAGVLIVGFIGAIHARFEPRGMSQAFFATAIAQALVPLIAMLWVPEERFTPGRLPVLGLNAVFVAAWLASALLFRQAGEKRAKVSA